MADPPVEPPPRIYIDLIGDLFHVGHLRHLDKAKSLGGTLVVGVFDDAAVERLSHVPVNTLEERVAVISALRCVDEVIPAAPVAPDAGFLDRYDIDSICLTDDFEDPERQQAMAALMDEGAGIVLPYTEDLTTADIVARVAGANISPPHPAKDRHALIHPAVSPGGRADDALLLDAVGAIAAGVFGRNWMLARDRLGDRTWLSLLKCMAANAIERDAPGSTDPRFLSALASLVARHATPGDSVNLIGNAADMAGAALCEQQLKVTILRPGKTPPSVSAAARLSPCDYVYCDVGGLPDAMPPADVTAVIDPAWSALLIVDAALLFESMRRLKRDLILAVDFWPETSGSFLPADRDGRFYFSDTYVRNVLHGQGFFDVTDILTTHDGAPLPDGNTGCGRISRHAMVEEDYQDGSFRYLDGGEPTPVGPADNGRYLRWYRASKIAIGPDEA